MNASIFCNPCAKQRLLKFNNLGAGYPSTLSIFVNSLTGNGIRWL
jgi:hypothetical protein